MTAAALETQYPALPGFAAANRSLIHMMIDCGWTGRITSKNHWLGKAPDGKTTITVPSKNSNNRGLANTKAQFTRWLRTQPTAMDIPVEMDGSIADAVILEGAARKMVKEAAQKKDQRAEPVIRPWLARKQPGPNGGTRYESQAVLERVWPDGHSDYLCAHPDCGYASDKPVSVARHFGAAHTRKGEQPAEPGPLHPDPEYREPVNNRTYQPTERLIMAAAEAIRALMEDEEATPESIARCFLEWAHERPDIDHEPRNVEPLTDRQMLDKIRLIVGQPDQSERIEELEATIHILSTEVARLKDEKAALRDLLTEE